MSRPPSLPPLPTISTAGIEESESGERKVASSRRPDGTLRKELKIRPGYTPEEDISKYRTARGAEQAAREKLKGRIPGLPPPGSPVAAALAGMSKAQKKNVKRKEKKEGEKEGEEETPDSWDADEDSTTTAKAKVESKATPVATPPPETETPPVASEVEESKKVKALKKKLRQAELLKERETLGLYLPPAERAKVKGIPDLEAEIAKLSLGGDEEEGAVTEAAKVEDK